MKEKLALIVTIFVIVAFCFGAYQYLDKFALKEALAQTQQEFKYFKADQQREALQDRVEKMEEKYEKKSMSEEAKTLYKDLKKRLGEKEKELKKMEEVK